mgnify:CR=1 FL=1
MPDQPAHVSAQAEFVARHLRLHAQPVTDPAARRLAILALDTYAIASHARATGTGATRADAALAGPGDVPVWGGGQSDLQGAAFLNGCAAEALDFQEVLIDGRNNGHAAVVIVPALLALAAERGLAGGQVLAALRTGFVANVALARALGRGHRRGEAGFRTTAMAAPVAGALACALAAGADEAQANHATAIAAATLPAGLLAAMSPLSGDFSVDKDLSVGFSARHAVECGLLAMAGATGPADVLAGPRGWLASYGFGDTDTGALRADPSATVLEQYALKLYPANFGCQCAIRLALEVAETTPLHDIAEVEVRVKESSAASLSTRRITSHVAARFSLAYAVASAMVRGRSVLGDYEGESLSDPDVLSFTDRITVIGDARLEARHQSEGIFPARLTITRSDGGIRHAALDMPQDGMGRVALDAAFARKIHSLCPEAVANRLLHLLDTGAYQALTTALTTGKETR